ncbi:MAG: glycosyltransferase family 9 protein [Elusimicrobia bacterium]|nr:glycosyltransferase family 9 protein [Elusimicrobiota bacterium]
MTPWLKRMERSAREVIAHGVRLVRGPRPLQTWENILSPPPPRILAIRMDGMGDMVLTLPTLRALRERCPTSHIALLTVPQNVPIVERLPILDEVIFWEKRRWLAVFHVLIRLRRARFEVAVDLSPAASLTNGLLARWAARVAGSFEKRYSELFYNVRVPLTESHHVLIQATMIKAFGGRGERDGSSRRWEFVRIPYTVQERQRVENFLRLSGVLNTHPLVGLNLGNGNKGLDRRWSPQKYATVAAWLLATYPEARIVLLWGPPERHLIPEFLQALEKEGGSSSRVLIPPPLTFPELAALLDRLDLMIGTPTGPLHLAVAMGTPVLALCRAWVYDEWRPLDPQHHSLRVEGDTIDALHPEDVIPAVPQCLTATSSRVIGS